HALRRRGHRVIVVAPAHKDAIDDDPDVFRFHSTSFPFYPQLRMAFPLPARLLTSLPRMPFDIIHSHSFFFVGCLGAYLAQRRQTPLVFTYHTLFTQYTHYLPLQRDFAKSRFIWLSREFSNRCDRIIVPTHYTAAELNEYGVSKPIDVLPTGVDMALFEGGAIAPETHRARCGGEIALFAGRLGKEKNLDLVLDGFSLAARRLPRARLVIAGEGPYENELRKHADALACADRIEFTGSLEKSDLGSWYRAADAFVFASTTETQGLVLVEAMAHGVPVVAVDCPVSREVGAGGAVALVEESVEALADALCDALACTGEIRTGRVAASRIAATPYAVDSLCERLEALYYSALAS
ncbi:MAG TPA: glycosyltransferase, partial [Candidatus Eremiobacteraceae bacterium]|nr:glycosyltransferase [Candidatus Eremiobacteraceae bacterium]